MSSTSASQSTATERTCCTWPLLSPLSHSLLRLRLKKWVLPVSSVLSTASLFIQAIMRTSPDVASCTMAGIRPLPSNFSVCASCGSIGRHFGESVAVCQPGRPLGPPPPAVLDLTGPGRSIGPLSGEPNRYLVRTPDDGQ